MLRDYVAASLRGRILRTGRESSDIGQHDGQVEGSAIDIILFRNTRVAVQQSLVHQEQYILAKIHWAQYLSGTVNWCDSDYQCKLVFNILGLMTVFDVFLRLLTLRVGGLGLLKLFNRHRRVLDSRSLIEDKNIRTRVVVGVTVLLEPFRLVEVPLHR